MRSYINLGLVQYVQQIPIYLFLCAPALNLLCPSVLDTIGLVAVGLGRLTCRSKRHQHELLVSKVQSPACLVSLG